jgi:GDP-4-dehydro-6-deoxy-D-mannose reductase
MTSNGHEVLEAEVDVRDRDAVHQVIADAQPEGIAHLAAITHTPEATAEPDAAFAVAVGGTINVLEAARDLQRAPAVLVTGSSEVYGSPDPAQLPLTETSRIAPATVYALSKAAQESVALSYAARYSIPVVVTRAFNHTGPGQRPVFVVPALARRIRDVAEGRRSYVRTGNLDLKRDIGDVRDVVRAYRLVLEKLAGNGSIRYGQVFNVCTGAAVSLRWIAEEFLRLAAIRADLRRDDGLARPGDAPAIWGDPSCIKEVVGWHASIPIQKTLADVWAASASQEALASPGSR